jgi:hypothetical protein
MSTHLITVVATSVRYEGQSVGRELTLDAEIAGELISCNFSLAPGETRELNREIVQLWVDGDNVAFSGQLQVTERDVAYSESGRAAVSWNLDSLGSDDVERVERIAVTEVGRKGRSATGLFFVTLRARVKVARRYVQEPRAGWLRVTLDGGQNVVSLPESLCVELTRVAEGREYFVIKEGPHRGKRASVRLDPDGTSSLGELDPRSAAVRAVYSISRKSLTVANKAYATVDYPLRPWSLGTYDIEIPDSPHKGGLSYPEASRSRTWFRIGHGGDRYLHTGGASAGCVTVVDRSQWDQLCSVLVKDRKGDGVSVGTLQVKE